MLDSLVQQLLLFVQGTASCQQIDDHSDDDDEEEGAEDHDFILMDSVTDGELTPPVMEAAEGRLH